MKSPRSAMRPRFDISRHALPRMLAALGACLLAVLAGCAGDHHAGTLQSTSLRDAGPVLPGRYVTAFYAAEPRGAASFMLADAPLEQVLSGSLAEGQILHVELLWLPKPGATPMDRSAANASVRYVIFSRGEAGIYGGLGFATLDDDLEGSRVTVSLVGATLQLLDSTPGFVDLLSPVQVQGTFTAINDDRRARELRNAASQLVTNALGRTRYVRR